MTQRSGSADLPLHGGRVPKWLGDRMTRLGAVLCEAIIHHYGRDELLRRLAHPFWFQSFGAVMGMDWHSSGITTSVVGALKRGLNPMSRELGIHVCGGRGAHSRKTPQELAAIGERVGIDGAALATASRLVAKVDSAAVQDGFDLYLHGFIVTDDSRWVVVQQGMNGDTQAGAPLPLAVGRADQLRRPAACGDRGRAARRDRQPHRPSRRAVAHRAARPVEDHEPGADPGRACRAGAAAKAPPAQPAAQPMLPNLVMPAHHDVRESDIVMHRLHGNISAAIESGPADFPELLLVPGVGARTVRALAMVAEVVHGAPCRFSDPARFSLAHGGKDRHPFPVPLKVYDETIAVLKSAVGKAKLGREEELGALQRLDGEARRLERYVTGPSLKEIVAGEFDQSHLLGGRSVFGWEKAPEDEAVRTIKKGA